jgi:hypothetical protein
MYSHVVLIIEWATREGAGAGIINSLATCGVVGMLVGVRHNLWSMWRRSWFGAPSLATVRSVEVTFDPTGIARRSSRRPGRLGLWRLWRRLGPR